MVSRAGTRLMRVLHVIKVVRIAGAERHLLMLLAGLRARDVDAQIMLLHPPRNPMDDFVQAASAREIPVQRIAIKHHLDTSVVGQLRDLFRYYQPDVAHTHLLHADLFGIPAARLARVPVVVTSRHNDNAFRKLAPIRWANRVLWGRVDAGIAISEAIRRFCIKVEGAPANKLHTIYYGLDRKPEDAERNAARASMRAELGVTPEQPVIGIACRLIEQKGVSFALQAFAQIAPKYPDAQMVIAGEGPLRDFLQAKAKTLNVADRVRFLGWREDVTRVLAGFDVLLNPSLWEGFGLVMLEAMAQRVPIIGSAVSAIPEVIVEGETGLLVPPRDVGALAAAINTLLADAPLRQHMGLLGEDRLEERFSAARMVDETLELYRGLVSRRRR
jgi:glycosyltransferase involved in cell wall biosynthesis